MATPNPTQREGAKGNFVVEIQTILNKNGFNIGKVDGTFGPRTKQGVIAFQTSRGLGADGIVGPKTWAALRDANPSPPTQREGDKGPLVIVIQTVLNNIHFNVGAVDGTFGPKTKQGVIAFQASRGLGADGIVGPKTWAALGEANRPPVEPPPDPIPEPPTGGVSLAQLQAIMPNLPTARANEVLPHLNHAMAEASINTPLRQAAFLAQLAHESVEFKFFEEIADGSQYEGREDLGNVNPGDGKRYKGRGPIQLTGRSNYRAAGQALGLDLEGNPPRAADVDVGFRTATWFWNSHNLNPLADQGDFLAITESINGGTNGLAAREEYYARAKQVLGA